MKTKTQLMYVTGLLPENQANDCCVFIAKVQKGLKDSQDGKVYTKLQAKDKLRKWLK